MTTAEPSATADGSHDGSASARDGAHTSQVFVLELGAALSEMGEPVYAVQERLARVARTYGDVDTRITAFPTFVLVALAQGEPALLEISAGVGSPRLDQLAALDRLATEAERGEVTAADGLRCLTEIRASRPRFGEIQTILGVALLAVGVCLVLQSSTREVVASAVLGALVGILRPFGSGNQSLRALVPLVAALAVSALAALAVRHDLLDTGLRPVVAALIVFVPGAALTTSVLELAAGQMVSGASRLVSAVVQLGLLAFGIIAGIEAAGVRSVAMFADSVEVLGDWSPWLGVFVFAVGVVGANSAPARSLPGLVLVLYAAWSAQVLGNELVGGYVSALVGALAMTVVASLVARLPSALPQRALFLPGYWLLVPGALGLIGLAQVAGDADAAGLRDLAAAIVSTFAVAIGVLCGALVLDSIGRGVTRSLPSTRSARDR